MRVSGLPHHLVRPRPPPVSAQLFRHLALASARKVKAVGYGSIVRLATVESAIASAVPHYTFLACQVAPCPGRRCCRLFWTSLIMHALYHSSCRCACNQCLQVPSVQRSLRALLVTAHNPPTRACPPTPIPGTALQVEAGKEPTVLACEGKLTDGPATLTQIPISRIVSVAEEVQDLSAHGEKMKKVLDDHWVALKAQRVKAGHDEMRVPAEQKQVFTLSVPWYPLLPWCAPPGHLLWPFCRLTGRRGSASRGASRQQILSELLYKKNELWQ